MDRLEAMSIVLAVAEAGSLSAGARRLNTPVATASRKIVELEAHLRTKLFDHSTRKLALTTAGSSYVEAARRILADLGEAERVASGEYAAPTGELLVTAPVGLGQQYLIPILAEFLRTYPKIDIRLLLNDRILGLTEDHIDVALRLGMLPDSRLIALRLGAFRRIVCASPTYLAARGTPLTPDDLIKHDCILYEGLAGAAPWNFMRGKAHIKVELHPRLVVSNSDAACNAAREGIGITRAFSYNVATSLEAGTLVTLLETFEPPTLPASFVYPSGRFQPVKLRAFLDFATPRLKARLAMVNRGHELLDSGRSLVQNPGASRPPRQR
jgi:DNA-binding transcriptional LysR family regulator